LTIFVDSANIQEIQKWVVEYGVAKGVTTNQKIFLEEKGINFETRIKDILNTLPEGCPVSVELTKTNSTDKDLIEEAILYKTLEDNNKHGVIVIKVPMWGDGRGLRIANKLVEKAIPVNMTCCMSVNQAILACEMDVPFVSFFYNRIIDYDKTVGKQYPGSGAGFVVIHQTRNIIEQQEYETQIIAGSIRKPDDVEECFRAGAHIVTIPPKILKQLPFHPKTEETIKEFDEAWKQFIRGKKNHG